MEQIKHEDIQNILSRTNYLLNVKTINNIRFTEREIDIMPCIVGGR